MSRFGLGLNNDGYRSTDLNTILLLHFDGQNGSTNFFDSSPYARPVTVYGDAQISTAQSPFGGSSAAFDGTGDGLSVPDSADLNFGSSDFTLEVFGYLNSTSVVQTILTKRAAAGGNTSPFHIIFNNAGSRFEFYSTSNGSTNDIANGASMGSAAINTWYHIAVTRSGNSIRLFNTGTQVGSTITTSASLYSNSDTVRIGAQGNGTANSLNGYLRQVRISNVARWTSNFTPPSAPYV